MADYDPNAFEMNEDVIPPDDEDTLLTPSADITQNETSFTTPESSQENQLIDSYRDSFKSKYGIDEGTFDTLRLNLKFRGNKLYYEDAQITRKDGKGLYALSSIKGNGAVDFNV